MSQDGWSILHRYWSGMKPPLRPNAEVAAAFMGAIADRRDAVLMLGVTPEICDIAADTVALDSSRQMIAHIWPGDTPARRALQGDWLAMPFERQFSAVIGDGSLNVIRYGQYPGIFAEFERVLLPGARLAIRVYVTPRPCETVAQLRVETMEGLVAGFHPFKWRLIMAIAAEQQRPDIAVTLVHQVFQREFPDRVALARATGWTLEDIAEIDLYAGMASVYCFPRRDEILEALPRSFADPRFISSGTYPVAEHCPILVADYQP